VQIDQVSSFSYFGTVVNGNNKLEEKIRERIAKGNKTFFSNRTIFRSILVCRKYKLKLYWSVIRPVVVYGCEAWVFEESIIQRLSVFGRKILRKIFGPTKKDIGTWRIKTNKEFYEVINHRNIINYLSQVINQLDAQNFCFMISLFHASTFFEHMCSSSGGQNCITQPLVSSH